MEAIVSYFSDLGINLSALLRFSAIILLGALVLSVINRFIFRRQTMLVTAISSSIAIVFIYVVTVLVMVVATDLRFLAAPLPFVSISQDALTFFTFHGNSYSAISAQVLSMILLSFLVNLIDSWLPRGKKLLNWLSFRCLTVIFGFLAHYLVTMLFNHYCPQFIILYAPAVLLGILLIMLLTGALRLLVGLILTTVNPIIAALYTFFFATIIGKQVTKAVLTTGILSCVVLLMEKHGIFTLSLLTGALVAYIPFLLVLIPIWYVVSRP